jgi:hypothetical protein
MRIAITAREQGMNEPTPNDNMAGTNVAAKVFLRTL